MALWKIASIILGARADTCFNRNENSMDGSIWDFRVSAQGPMEIKGPQLPLKTISFQQRCLFKNFFRLTAII